MPSLHEIEAIERQLTSSGVDLPVTLHVDREALAAMQHAVTSLDASAAVIDDPTGEWLNAVQAGDATFGVPLLLVSAVASRTRRVVARPDVLVRSVPVDEIARRLAPARSAVVIDDGASGIDTGASDLVVNAAGADRQSGGDTSTIVTVV